MDLTKEAQGRLKISQLAKATQVCGISNRNSLPTTARALVAKADASKQPLSVDELKAVCDCCKTSEYAVALLIAESSQVVNAARQQLLKHQPNLILPGGELYPENRAEACWRDCQQFLRVIIYGVACNCTEITVIRTNGSTNSSDDVCPKSNEKPYYTSTRNLWAYS